ncbi:MAG: HEAT repeat domain-containing protein [Bryobacterales bacterium]|nr:HEAT repeat domain-containing protein [Bryobacterales bacterium]
MLSRRLGQAAMWLRGIAILAAFFYPVWTLHVHVFAQRIEEAPLSLAASFLTVQAGAILLQLLASCAFKWAVDLREGRSRRARPRILRELAAHVAGDDRRAALRKLERRYATDFDRSMERFLSLVTGESRERLTVLASELRLVSRWERRARYANDREQRRAVECLGLLAGARGGKALRRLARRSTPLVEAAACRMLARSADQRGAEQVFSLIVGKGYLVRVLLAGEMRRHALDLCDSALPIEAASVDTRRLTAALELAESWRMALRLPFLAEMMQHPSPEVRARALRLAPLAAGGQDVEPYILAALDEDSELVKAAALSVTASLRAPSLLPLLERFATGDSGELARLACAALRGFGPEGVGILRKLLLYGDARSAARAAEALASGSGPALGLEPA